MTAPDLGLAALTGAAAFPLPGRTLLVLTGSKRASHLHGFCTNNINRLGPGEGCEAFVANVKGRVLGQIWVAAEAESLRINTVPGAAAVLVPHLQKYLLGADVTITDETSHTSTWFVSGLTAAAPLAHLLGVAPPAVEYHHAAFAWRGETVRLQRFDGLGAPGWFVQVPVTLHDALHDELVANDVTIGGEADWQGLRIAALWPEYDVDISDENLAQEVARTARAISFTKGCYLGQEPIARLDAMGHTNRELCGVRLPTASEPPPRGTAVVHPETGQPLGTITSAAPDPLRGGCNALAYIKTSVAKADAAVVVTAGSVSLHATIYRAPLSKP